MKDQERTEERARRHHDRAFKAGLVEQSLRSGASVSAIALEAGINANLLFKWRREHQRAHAVATTSAVLLPVRLAPIDVHPSRESLPTASAPPAAASVARSARGGVIELEFAGAQLRLRGAVDEDSLCSVLRALRQSA